MGGGGRTIWRVLLEDLYRPHMTPDADGVTRWDSGPPGPGESAGWPGNSPPSLFLLDGRQGTSFSRAASGMPGRACRFPRAPPGRVVACWLCLSSPSIRSDSARDEPRKHLGTAWDQENVQTNLSFLLEGSLPIFKASEDLGTLRGRPRPSVQLLLVNNHTLLFPRLRAFHGPPWNLRESPATSSQTRAFARPPFCHQPSHGHLPGISLRAGFFPRCPFSTEMTSEDIGGACTASGVY